MLCHDAWHLNANCLGGVDSLKALDNPITLADLCSERLLKLICRLISSEYTCLVLVACVAPDCLGSGIISAYTDTYYMETGAAC